MLGAGAREELDRLEVEDSASHRQQAMAAILAGWAASTTQTSTGQLATLAAQLEVARLAIQAAQLRQIQDTLSSQPVPNLEPLDMSALQSQTLSGRQATSSVFALPAARPGCGGAEPVRQRGVHLLRQQQRRDHSPT